MKIKNENLNPCPFCGNTKLSVNCKSAICNEGYYQTYSVRCNSCHARGGVVSGYIKKYRDGFESIAVISKDDLIQQAIDKWNGRV